MERQTRLSVEELKSFEGFEQISDEEAEAVITSLESLAFILFELYQQQSSEQSNTKIINLNQNNDSQERHAA